MADRRQEVANIPHPFVEEVDFSEIEHIEVNGAFYLNDTIFYCCCCCNRFGFRYTDNTSQQAVQLEQIDRAFVIVFV